MPFHTNIKRVRGPLKRLFTTKEGLDTLRKTFVFDEGPIVATARGEWRKAPFAALEIASMLPLVAPLKAGRIGFRAARFIGEGKDLGKIAREVAFLRRLGQREAGSWASMEEGFRFLDARSLQKARGWATRRRMAIARRLIEGGESSAVERAARLVAGSGEGARARRREALAWLKFFRQSMMEATGKHGPERVARELLTSAYLPRPDVFYREFKEAIPYQVRATRGIVGKLHLVHPYSPVSLTPTTPRLPGEEGRYRFLERLVTEFHPAFREGGLSLTTDKALFKVPSSLREFGGTGLTPADLPDIREYNVKQLRKLLKRKYYPDVPKRN